MREQILVVVNLVIQHIIYDIMIMSGGDQNIMCEIGIILIEIVSGIVMLVVI